MRGLLIPLGGVRSGVSHARHDGRVRLLDGGSETV
jgi:hypothetical protein